MEHVKIQFERFICIYSHSKHFISILRLYTAR